MDILTEQGDTYDECLSKITAKYGPNVHILRQKRIKMGGFLGFFEKDGIELSFMITRDPLRGAGMRPASFEEERAKILRKAAPHLESSRPLPVPDATVVRETAPSRETATLRETAPLRKTSPAREPPSRDMEILLQAVKKLEQKIDRSSDSEKTDQGEHETLVKIEQLLEQNDFSASFIKSILTRVKNEFTLDSLGDFQLVQDTVVDWIGERIAIYESEPTARPRTIVLVGPTGVGKTTTVAKLAAAFALGAVKGSRPLNVRIITIDNYRIGAKQQIETYGNIMNIPVSYAETSSDLTSLIALHQDVDIILIDTIGKSPKDYSKIAEMRSLLDSAGQVSDVFLAMSATTKASDMREIMMQYETFGYGSVIITKFDETARIGNIVSVLNERSKPLAYITTGQRVPQDFEKATVVRLLINLEGFRINRTRVETLFPASETRFEWR